MTVTDRDLDQLIAERQVRLMLLGPQQRPIWEASPSPLHQIFVRDIEASIRASAESRDDCACEHIADAYIRLPDSSLVRPDIAIFCAPIPRQREAYAAVPAAVIEIVSPNYEVKDYEELPPVYLANGVRDVVVVDPEQSVFTHYRPGHTRSIQQLPHQLHLECGCLVQLPA
jgi:Uma2 family endonuclease